MKYENVEVNSERWLDLTLLLNEEFRDIVDYEGLYQVSNYGRVKSFMKWTKDNKKERILKQTPDSQKYLRCCLLNKPTLIHKIVANTFLNNNNNYPCINHIDGNKTNNKVENLEFCTYKHNINEAYRLGLNPAKGKLGKLHHNYKLINQYDLDGNFIKQWYGFHEIDRTLNFDYRNIHACCNKKQKTAYGFIWKYHNECEVM